jgi:hypothetical protein
VGKLRSMVLTVSEGRGLFSVLRQILNMQTENSTRLRFSADLHVVMEYFCLLDAEQTPRSAKHGYPN